VPVTLKGGAVHEVFLKKHLDESPEDFRAQWRKAVFTGQGAMPKACDSESALIDYVAATPGALGYVSRIFPQDQDKVKSLVAIKKRSLQKCLKRVRVRIPDTAGTVKNRRE
jgi:hypothetical protein